MFKPIIAIDNQWQSGITINGFSGGDIAKVSVDSIAVLNSSIVRLSSKVIDLSDKTESVKICLLFENYVDGSGSQVNVCTKQSFSCTVTSSKFDDPLSGNCGWNAGNTSNCTGCFE